MKIPFTLNNESVVFDAEPDAKLLQLLRKNGFLDVKEGCKGGLCTACTVLLNGIPVPSCLVTAASIRDNRIVTLDYFKKTAEYIDIEQGFAQAEAHLCGYCDAGKILTAFSIITSNPRPTREEIFNEVKHFPCKCTDTDTLINGILFAAAARRNRLSGMSHGKK